MKTIKSSPAIAAALASGALMLAPLGHDRGPGRNAHGEVCLANESRFTTATFSEGLTAYLTGWQDPENLTQVLDFLSPDVTTGRRFEFKRAVNAQALLSETDDVRAIGSPFKRVEYTGDTVLGKTLNKGLTMRIDHDQVATNIPNWENRYVAFLRQRLLRNDVRRAFALIDASVTDVAKVWNTAGTAVDPDGDIIDMLKLATDASGIRPNRVLYATDAWDLRRKSYQTLGTIAAGYSARLTTDDVAGVLRVKDVRVLEARYQSTATAKALLSTALRVYCYYEEPMVMLDDASNFKRFVSPCEDGSMVRVFIERGAKYTDITVEAYSVIVAAHTLGVMSRTVSSS
jgi:hypothetical protein